MKFYLLLFICFIPLLSPAFEPSKIFGTNDLLAVNAEATNIPLKYKSLVNAFGLMSVSCSATHIGNGYVLTAGHCFWVGSELAQDLPCGEISIEWGVRQGLPAYLKSTCERVLFAQRSTTNDFAIIKVSPVPNAFVEVELSRKALASDSLTLFSHPQKLPLRWSGTCTVETSLDPLLSATTLQHKCDTNPGSSGASILDPATNKIVGIHNGGRATAQGVGMNYGTFITNPELLTALKLLGFN